MKNFALLVYLGIIIFAKESTRWSAFAVELGKFWQVTDFHYDSKYSQNGDRKAMCHDKSDKHAKQTLLGEYGDYACDAPWKLIQSAVSAMKSIDGNPDFILWTGDNVPHLSEKELTEKMIYTLIKNVTTLLRTTFPNSTLYPVFGNHDPYPNGQMSPSGGSYYQNIASTSGWDALLKPDEMKTFLKGGYYTTLVKVGLRVIALNTPLYYVWNKLVNGTADPADQFKWLSDTLKTARTRDEQILLVAHIPPGMFGKVANISWFYPDFNKNYMSLLSDYNDIILGQFYGHEHTDGFRVVYDDKGTPVNSMFLAPAITPWNSTLPGAGFNNPSFRQFLYDRETGKILDYIQYYLNLTAANMAKKSTWTVEYQMTKDYNITDVSPASLNSLLGTMEAKSSPVFDKYVQFYSVSADMDTKCVDMCKKAQICAAKCIDYDQYHACLGKGDHHPHPHDNRTHHHHSTTHHPHRPHHPPPRYMLYIIIVLSVLVVVLFIVVVVMCLKKHFYRMHTLPRYKTMNINS